MQCGQGSGTVSNLVSGLDWVATDARRPAVASLSLGVPVGNWSRRGVKPSKCKKENPVKSGQIQR